MILKLLYNIERKRMLTDSFYESGIGPTRKKPKCTTKQNENNKQIKNKPQTTLLINVHTTCY